MVFSTASCSMPVVTIWRRPEGSSASAAPRSARLSASVPLPVKTTSLGSASISAATLRARVVEQGLGALSEGVHGRRIAKFGAEYTIDGLDDLRSGRCRRVVVEIDAHRACEVIVASAVRALQ